MPNEKTCSDFHGAKFSMEAELIEFRRVGDLDDRDVAEELCDCILDVYGADILEELVAYQQSH